MTLVLYDHKLNVKMTQKQVIGFQITEGCSVLCWTDRDGKVYYQQLAPGELLALREEER